MKQILFPALVAATLVTPAAAQEPSDGPSLMEQGAQMFLDGLMKQVEPAMKDLQALAQDMGPALRSFVEEMGPAFGEILGDIKDFSAYHPPEILPNGDIIIRKKIPDEEGDEALPDGEIEI
ncbi:hypothetical protein OO012_01580 [Rhodobacteraceae bacterium KMM 6894]|nr:hypothetical protein [Rhodobacteraceae bacterium KMM 6894]